MEQNNNQIDNRQPCFRKVIGNTTYVVRVHFSETSKEILKDKIKRLLQEEIKE
ncbi:MAG: transposon-encoded TnpW family protein [Christensenellaceae bacterium]|nr:transposon-encoded TnpW family protein [Christensenellaceae bacterium]